MTERMTADQFNKTTRKKPIDREGPIQIEIVQWLRRSLPEGSIVHHCKNEINKGGRAFAMEQARATQLGAVKGFLDLIVLPYACVGPIFFEVKAPGNTATETQKQVHSDLEHLGYRVAIVHSVADVRECLIRWGVGFVETVELRGCVR